MEAQHANRRGGLAARVTLAQDREIARISAYSKDSQYTRLTALGKTRVNTLTYRAPPNVRPTSTRVAKDLWDGGKGP